MSVIVAIQSIATVAVIINAVFEPLRAVIVNTKPLMRGKLMRGKCWEGVSQNATDASGLCGSGQIVFDVCGIYLNFMCLRLAIVLRNGFSSSEEALARWGCVGVEEEEFASPEKCKGCQTGNAYARVWDRTTNSVGSTGETGWIYLLYPDSLPGVLCFSFLFSRACVQHVCCCNCMFGLCCLTLQRVCYACEDTKYVKRREKGGPIEYMAATPRGGDAWTLSSTGVSTLHVSKCSDAQAVTRVVGNPMAGRSSSSASKAPRDFRTRSLAMHGDSSGEGGDNAAQPEGKSVVKDGRETEEKTARHARILRVLL